MTNGDSIIYVSKNVSINPCTPLEACDGSREKPFYTLPQALFFAITSADNKINIEIVDAKIEVTQADINEMISQKKMVDSQFIIDKNKSLGIGFNKYISQFIEKCSLSFTGSFSSFKLLFSNLNLTNLDIKFFKITQVPSEVRSFLAVEQQSTLILTNISISQANFDGSDILQNNLILLGKGGYDIGLVNCEINLLFIDKVSFGNFFNIDSSILESSQPISQIKIYSSFFGVRGNSITLIRSNIKFCNVEIIGSQFKIGSLNHEIIFNASNVIISKSLFYLEMNMTRVKNRVLVFLEKNKVLFDSVSFEGINTDKNIPITTNISNISVSNRFYIRNLSVINVNMEGVLIE